MSDLLPELRYAARRLARTPGFTLIALVTLAVAIGATTAVFSLANGVLLKPLGFVRPDRLVYLRAVSASGQFTAIAAQDLLDYQSQSHSFTDIVAVDPGRSFNLTRPSAPAVRVGAARVGAGFFSLLGVDAKIGRTFVRGEDAKGAGKVVVLSDPAWHRYFGGDPGVVGHAITLDGEPYVVIGIAPSTLTYPGNPDFWYPAVWRAWEIGDANRGNHSIHGIARLRDGVSLLTAQHDLGVVAARIAQAFPREDAKVGVSLVPLREHLVGNVEAPLWEMFGAVAFVLLIACANVANLLLVRASSRTAEVAVRTALGAGRRRLVQQFLTESMMLSVAGAVLGTAMSIAALRAATAAGGLGIPRIEDVTVDWRVLAFATALTVATGLGFGLLPALHTAGGSVARLLRSGGRGHTARRSRARSVLVVAELTLGTVLLVGAGLLIRSFDRLTHVDPGFRAGQLTVFDAALFGERYATDAGVNAFVDRVQSGLAALPGVQAVGVAAERPFDRDPPFSATISFTVQGAPPPSPGSEPIARVVPVSPSFFGTMGMTLARGRVFSDDENRRAAAPVVVINEALADRYFPGQDPIGKQVTFGITHDVSPVPGDTVRAGGEIVGIVHNVHFSALDRPPEPAAFFPFHTQPFGATFVVRANVEPAALARDIRAVVAAVDPGVPAFELGTMEESLSASVAQHRFYTALLSGFAAAALLLATLGVYGVISYAVSQQTRDFGIRIALGARARDVVNLVVGRGAALIGAGLAAGIIGAVLLTRLIRGLLFGVDPLDGATFGAVCVVFAAAGIVASWLPARRASRVDPVIAMRGE